MIQCIKNTAADLTTVEFIGLGNTGERSGFSASLSLRNIETNTSVIAFEERDKSIIKYVDGIEDGKRKTKYTFVFSYKNSYYRCVNI